MQPINAEDSNARPLILLDMENPVFRCYLFWCSVLIIKMLIMSLLTAIRRMANKAFVNTEDLVMGKVTEVQLNNPHVERVRRAHLNDLENILPFMIGSLAYLSTDPHPVVACILFRVAAVSRIFHTMVYAFRPVPQPARALAFFVTFWITTFMVVHTAYRTLRFI